MNELEVVEGCKNGEKSAMEKVYIEFSPQLLSVCLRYMGSKQEAEDVMHEGFIKIFMNVKKFKNTGSFYGWLKRIMVNTCIDEIRKRKYEEDIDSQYSLSSNALSQLDEMSIDELHNTIKKMPVGFRTVLNMYAIEGYSHKEIGLNLGITESSSRSQLSRAKKYLANILNINNKIIISNE